MSIVKNERGMVLLLVLLVVALLATVLTELSFSTLIDMRLAETFRDTTRANYLARGGLKVGRMILQDDKNNYDANDELWAMGVQQYPVADGDVSIEIVDLSGRVALNLLYDKESNSPNQTIQARYIELLNQLDIPDAERLVDTLLDWIDPDDIVDGQGAENSEYSSRPHPIQTKNGDLDGLEELLLVEGYTPDIVKRLRPHVTAYGSLLINVNTASREVLMSLSDDMDLTTAESLLDRRQMEPFTAKSQVADLLGLESKQYSSISGNIDVKSLTFQIESTGRVNDGRTTMQAVVDETGRKIKFQRVL